MAILSPIQPGLDSDMKYLEHCISTLLGSWFHKQHWMIIGHLLSLDKTSSAKKVLKEKAVAEQVVAFRSI